MDHLDGPDGRQSALIAAALARCDLTKMTPEPMLRTVHFMCKESAFSREILERPHKLKKPDLTILDEAHMMKSLFQENEGEVEVVLTTSAWLKVFEEEVHSCFADIVTTESDRFKLAQQLHELLCGFDNNDDVTFENMSRNPQALIKAMWNAVRRDGFDLDVEVVLSNFDRLWAKVPCHSLSCVGVLAICLGLK